MASLKDSSLPNSARPRHPSSRFLKRLEAEKDIIFTVIIRRTPGGPPLPSLEDLGNTMPHERKFVHLDQYVELYGASSADMQTTVSGLRKYGMTILNQHLGARTVTVKATPPQVTAAFRVHLNVYQSPTPKVILWSQISDHEISQSSDTETHVGYDGKLLIPQELAGIIEQIVGLDTRSIAVHGGATGDPVNSVLQTVPAQAALYNFPNTGASDQTVGIFNNGGSYLPSDITTYFASMPPDYRTAPTVVDVELQVGGNRHRNDPGSITSLKTIGDATSETLEITQDIMTSTTIAQGCTANVYFSDGSEQGWVVFLNRILFPQNERQPNVVTISWIIPDETAYGSAFSNLFQQLATVGINVFAAVGDWGSDDKVRDGKGHLGYPASDPWVTAVGGTVVGNVQAGPPVTFDEFVWSDENNPSSGFSFDGGGTTGGGMSSVFPAPAYQTAAGITSFTDSSNNVKKGNRFVPDISGMVGYQTFFCNNLTYTFIGTSCTAPLYAGLFAVLRSSLGTSLGFLNPLLYALGTTAFKDVTFGSNDSNSTPAAPYFNAAAGYDPASGWGSIDGTRMHAALARLLFPPAMYVTVNKSSFGLAEVENQATWNATLFITLDGFAPNELPTTGPNVLTTLGSDVTTTVGKPLMQNSADSASVQRIMYPVDIAFGPKSIHPLNDSTTPGIFPEAGSFLPIEKSLIADLAVAGKSFEAITSIELLAGANPYFSNLVNSGSVGNVGDSHAWWLSDDLRVFTVCPGVNATPISSSSAPGAPRLAPSSLSGFDSNAGYSYISNLLNYLNGNFTSRTGQDAFALLPNQSNALTEESLVAPSQINPANSNSRFSNYTFAIARVRSNTATSGKPVKVFFRLFTSNHPQTYFLPATSFLSTPAAPNPPEAPLVASDMSSIPFFASGNYNSNSDYVSGGANSKAISNAGESYTYYGCFLNVYATDNKITFDGKTKPASAWLNGGHQCIVAQIAYDDAPVAAVNGVLASPMNSDKLAQRNLQVTLSDNPGPLDTHMVPQAFDTVPSPPPSTTAQFMDKPDELVIDWGNAPVGSTCEIYWPQILASDIVALANKSYRMHQLTASKADPNVLSTPVVKGFTIVPVPFGTGPNFAGLLTLQLPLGIVQGQELLITIRRIATRFVKEIEIPKIATRSVSSSESGRSFVNVSADAVPPEFARGPGSKSIAANNWRYTAGVFAIKIPVTTGRHMLPIERDNQAITAWRLNQMSNTDRWYPVMERYLSYLTRRINGLGGGKLPIVPSPIGAQLLLHPSQPPCCSRHPVHDPSCQSKKPCHPAPEPYHPPHKSCHPARAACHLSHQHCRSQQKVHYPTKHYARNKPDEEHETISFLPEVDEEHDYSPSQYLPHDRDQHCNQHHKYDKRHEKQCHCRDCHDSRQRCYEDHGQCFCCHGQGSPSRARFNTQQQLHERHASGETRSYRGKLSGLQYNRFGHFQSLVIDCHDGVRKEIACVDADLESLIKGFWDRRETVEVKIKDYDEDRYENLEGRPTLENITVLRSAGGIIF